MAFENVTTTWTIDPITQNDTFDLRAVIVDREGRAVDLTSLTVTFHAIQTKTEDFKIPITPKTIQPTVSIEDALLGKVKVRFTSSDTDTPGTYLAEFRLSGTDTLTTFKGTFVIESKIT